MQLIQKKIKEIEIYILELLQEENLLNTQLISIEECLTFPLDLNIETIKKIYNEVGIDFPDQLKLNLDDLITFYENLKLYRIKKLSERKIDIKNSKNLIKDKIDKLQSKLDELKWFWMMDYCKLYGMPPAKVWAWNVAEKAYLQWLKNSTIKENIKEESHEYRL